MTDVPSEYLLTQWQAGDQLAAATLYERYAGRLTAYARRHLSARVTSRVAPEDIVQSVYARFFAGAADGTFAVHQRGDLWRLLIAITVRKVRHYSRFHTAGRRSVERDRAFTDSSCGGVPGSALATGPAPDEEALLAEVLAVALAGLKPWEREAVGLRLRGDTLVEIADTTGRAFSTVQRLIDRVRGKLERFVDQ